MFKELLRQTLSPQHLDFWLIPDLLQPRPLRLQTWGPLYNPAHWVNLLPMDSFPTSEPGTLCDISSSLKCNSIRWYGYAFLILETILVWQYSLRGKAGIYSALYSLQIALCLAHGKAIAGEMVAKGKIIQLPPWHWNVSFHQNAIHLAGRSLIFPF